MQHQASKKAEEFDAQVILKALRSSAELLDLSQKDVAKILGTSEGSISNYYADGLLPRKGKQQELALFLARIFRSLDSILGGDNEKCRLWFHAHNPDLGGVPARLVENVRGLTYVAEYLDAFKGKV